MEWYKLYIFQQTLNEERTKMFPDKIHFKMLSLFSIRQHAGQLYTSS